MSTITINNIEYTIHKQKSGNLLLKPIKKIIINKIDDLSDYDFCFSKILYCSINDELCDKNKYKSILNEIYLIIDNGTKIIINTSINISTIKRKDSGFYYISELGISVQGIDSNKCIYEILNQCYKNNIKLKMHIELKNKEIIMIDI
jgi:hypothetical protein